MTSPRSGDVGVCDGQMISTDDEMGTGAARSSASPSSVLLLWAS